MAVFSVNQATQMYVDAEAKSTLNGYRWYQTADGASELIKESNIIYETDEITVSKTEASDMDVKAYVPTITVASPVKGAEYLVRLTISTDAGPQYAYIKSVGVVAADANATNVAKQIADALTKAAKRDVAGEYYTATNAAGVVTITPKVDYQVGKRFVVPVISVSVSVITDHEEATTEGWVVAPDKAVATGIIGTGYMKLKDLEYFCAGEKGDVYRGAAWPNDIPFESKITSAAPKVTTIHYYEDLGNEAVQKSEKTIVLVKN